jgi:hypothetical protein
LRYGCQFPWCAIDLREHKIGEVAKEYTIFVGGREGEDGNEGGK